MSAMFDQLALYGGRAVARPAPAPHENADKCPTKTDRIRQYLRAHGEASSADLAIEADVPSSAQVGALLKNDLAKGAIRKSARGYAWNYEFDDQVHVQLREAAALLRRHGYRVQPPVIEH
jgi:hypothetical protein